MRQGVLLGVVLLVGGIGLTAAAHAVPFIPGAGPAGKLAAAVERAQYYPPNVYRPYGYYPSVEAPPAVGAVTQPPIADGAYVPPPVAVVPPAAAVVTPAPVVVPGAPVVVQAAPAVVMPAPVIVVPPRPASCGEFRFWNGFACVDARFNQPYLGPRY